MLLAGFVHLILQLGLLVYPVLLAVLITGRDFGKLAYVALLATSKVEFTVLLCSYCTTGERGRCKI